MKVLYIHDIRRKIILFFVVIAFWLLIISVSQYLINRLFLYTVSIDNMISFSHPAFLQIDDIYINDFYPSVVRTSSPSGNFSNNKFLSYSSLKGKFTFKYPSAFLIDEKDFSGSDILYHIDFHDKAENIHGFIQVWNIYQPLKEFLENSKNLSQQNFLDFNSSPVSSNDMKGFFWDYSISTDEGKHIKGNEVFLENNGKMYRISLFVSEKNWNSKISEVFWNMVKSLKVN